MKIVRLLLLSVICCYLFAQCGGGTGVVKPPCPQTCLTCTAAPQAIKARQQGSANDDRECRYTTGNPQPDGTNCWFMEGAPANGSDCESKTSGKCMSGRCVSDPLPQGSACRGGKGACDGNGICGCTSGFGDDCHECQGCDQCANGGGGGNNGGGGPGCQGRPGAPVGVPGLPQHPG